MNRRVTLVVPPEADGRRVDEVAALLIAGLSRRQVQRSCAEGHVLVDGRFARKGQLLRAGTTLVVVLEPEEVQAEPDAPLLVRASSEHWVIVEKPPGQPTAPLSTGEVGTLVGALLGRYPEMRGFGYERREPGIIHRLDNGTSGLVLAARSRLGWDTLVHALSSGQLTKQYLAVVYDQGLADGGTIEFALAPHPRDSRRVIAVDSGTAGGAPAQSSRGTSPRPPWSGHLPGKVVSGQRPATTTFRVLRRRGGLALVEVTAKVAKRHQIRVHFAALGHPLLNDVLYGAPVAPGLAAGRHGLHAARLAWCGDAAVEGFEVTAPLWGDLADFWDGLTERGGFLDESLAGASSDSIHEST